MQLILAISDQQLVTGLAMLIGAFSQLNCGISFYHWQVATTLAWFASITHLATLPFLQEFLQRHKFLLCLRVMLMSGVAIMLSIALLRSGNPEIPAMCGTVANGSVAVSIWMSQNGVYTIFSEIILLGTLVTRLLRMFSHTSRVGMSLLRFVRAKWQASIIGLCRMLQARSRWTAAVFLWVPVLSLSVLVSVQTFFDFMRSRTWEVTVGLIYCILYADVQRYSGYCFPSYGVPCDYSLSVTACREAAICWKRAIGASVRLSQYYFFLYQSWSLWRASPVCSSPVIIGFLY